MYFSGLWMPVTLVTKPTVKLFSVLLTTAVTVAAIPAIAQPNSVQPSSGQPDRLIAQASSAQSMPAIAEAFVTLSAQGNFVEAWQYLHPSLRETWSPVGMQSAWHNLQERTGAFKQFLSFSQSSNDVVLVNTQFENVTDDLIVIFDDSQQWIVGVDFPEQR